MRRKRGVSPCQGQRKMRCRRKDLLKLGTWHWTVCSSRAHSLMPAVFRALEQVQRGDVSVIKRNPVRTVLHLPDNPEIILKYYTVRAADLIKYIILPSKAESEFKGAEMCRKAGIAAPQVLAWGENRHGVLLREACVVQGCITDAVPLGEYIRDQFAACTASDKAAVMRAAGSLLAKIHCAGLSHRDFHPGNILLRGDGSGDLEPFVIDLHSVRMPHLLLSRRRVKDIAKLYHSLGLITTDDHLDEMLAGYFDRAGNFRARKNRIARVARRLETARLRSRTARCVKESSVFTNRRVNRLSVYKRRDWSTEVLLSVLREHEEAKRLRDARLVKESRRSWVTVVPFSDRRYAPRLVVKEPRLGLPLVGRGRTPNFRRMRRAWVAANAFAVRGLGVPQHLALVERRVLGMPWRAWLISRYIENAFDLDRYLESHPDLPVAFLGQLAETISRVFHTGIYHGDLSGKNILIKHRTECHWDFYFLDLESVTLWRRLTRRRKRKNIAQLDRSIKIWCNQEQRDYFLSKMPSDAAVMGCPRFQKQVQNRV